MAIALFNTAKYLQFMSETNQNRFLSMLKNMSVLTLFKKLFFIHDIKVVSMELENKSLSKGQVYSNDIPIGLFVRL